MWYVFAFLGGGAVGAVGTTLFLYWAGRKGEGY
jgi:hypothetical protein